MPLAPRLASGCRIIYSNTVLPSPTYPKTQHCTRSYPLPKAILFPKYLQEFDWHGMLDSLEDVMVKNAAKIKFSNASVVSAHRFELHGNDKLC
jgi:hypothetical protein